MDNNIRKAILEPTFMEKHFETQKLRAPTERSGFFFSSFILFLLEKKNASTKIYIMLQFLPRELHKT